MNTISQPVKSNVTAPESGYKTSKVSPVKNPVEQKATPAVRGTELTISRESLGLLKKQGDKENNLDQLLKFYEDQMKSKDEEKRSIQRYWKAYGDCQTDSQRR